MDTNDLQIIAQKAGLTASQAKVYIALIKEDELTPAQMADLTGESRENCYSIAKRLVELNLAERTTERKTTYRALNPSALQSLAENRRRAIQRNEVFVKQNIETIMQLFYANSEMPGAHTIEGMSGIREVYNDMLHSKDDIYLLRTSFDAALGSAEEGFLRNFREQRAKNGITTYALTPDYPEARKYAQDGTDQKMLFNRIFMPADAYTGKVEIDIYGNKVAMIAFGETEMATVISSPAIAEAMRQIIMMLRDYYRLIYPQEEEL
jgi:sugar-specific transcriptional regulator TrmB